MASEGLDSRAVSLPQFTLRIVVALLRFSQRASVARTNEEDCFQAPVIASNLLRFLKPISAADP
jgi:hypothetical protein